MANLLPALEGLNQLLMKQVEKQEKDTKKAVGAQLVSEYDKKLQVAKNSEEVSKINSWFLTETQKRDVPEVQTTGYYMLNNYLPRFQKEEEKAEKLGMIQKDAMSFMEYYKNIKVGYNGQIITGDVVAKDLMSKNPTISSDEIIKHLGNLQVQEESVIGTDPTTRQIIKTTSYSSKTGGELGKKSSTINWVKGKGLYYQDQDGKMMKDGKEITSVAGQYDEGIDTLVNPSEILSVKGGQQALNAVYELDQPEPVRGGGRGGSGGRGGKMPETYNPFVSTPEQRVTGLSNTMGRYIERNDFGNKLDSDGKPIGDPYSVKTAKRLNQRLEEMESYPDYYKNEEELRVTSDFTSLYFSEKFRKSGNDRAEDITLFTDYDLRVLKNGNVSIMFPKFNNATRYIVDDEALKQALINQYEYEELSKSKKR